MFLTPEEYIRVNRNNMSETCYNLIGGLIDKIAEFKEENQEVDKRVEILNEQIYFAQSLIEKLSNWSSDLPKKKQKEMEILVSNSNFEC